MNGPLLQESESPWGFFLQLRGDSGQEKRSWEALKELSVPQECLKPVAPLYTSISAHTHPETCEGGWRAGWWRVDGWGGLQDPPASLRCFYTLCRCGQVQVGGGNVLCAFCVYNCLFYVCVWTGGQRGSGPSWTSWSCWLSWPEGRQSKRHTTSHDERWCVTQYCGYIMMSSHLIQAKSMFDSVVSH